VIIPRPCLFISISDLEHEIIPVPWTDDLETHRKLIFGYAGSDRGCRMSGNIKGIRERY